MDQGHEPNPSPLPDRKRHRGLSGRHSGFESFGLPDGVLSCLVLIWKDSYSHVFGRWAGGLGWTGT